MYLAAAEDLEENGDDDPDGDQARGDRDHIPGDTVACNRECSQSEHGDPETQPRQPRRDERALTARDAPEHAAGDEREDAEPEVQSEACERRSRGARSAMCDASPALGAAAQYAQRKRQQRCGKAGGDADQRPQREAMHS
jgi:hypothetical protein